MEPFVVGKATYMSLKMDAMTQFHVARRFAPFLSNVKPVLEATRSGNPLDALAPIATAIGSLDDKDAEYVLNTALDHVQRQVGGNGPWSKVRAGSGMMYDDITMVDMLNIAAHVLKDNFANFWPALLGLLPNGGDQA